MAHVVLPVHGKSDKGTGFGNQRSLSFKTQLAASLISLFLLFNQSLNSCGCSREEEMLRS